MALERNVRVRCALGAVALALAASGPAHGKPAEPRKAAGLGGYFLIAAPEMGDPRFSRTVVYLMHHDASGALGLIVNRPFEEVPIALLLDRLGQPHEGVSGSLQVHYGGPVDSGRVFVLHTTDYRADGTHVIADGIAVSAPSGVLRAIGAGAGPRRALLALGYSGWAAGQLEGEIRAGGWIAVPAEAALLFDEHDETKWQRAMARRKHEGIDL